MDDKADQELYLFCVEVPCSAQVVHDGEFDYQRRVVELADTKLMQHMRDRTGNHPFAATQSDLCVLEDALRHIFWVRVSYTIMRTR